MTLPQDTGDDLDRFAQLERRVSELEDERAIRYLITNYGYVSDFGGPDDLADLFTSDGALDIAMGSTYGEFATSERWEGRQRLHDFLADPEGRWDQSWYGNVMHVQGNNLEIRVAGGEASASGYALSVISRDGGLHLMGASVNRWHFKKRDGHWLVHERTLRPVGHAEFAAMVLGDGQTAADRG